MLRAFRVPINNDGKSHFLERASLQTQYSYLFREEKRAFKEIRINCIKNARAISYAAYHMPQSCYDTHYGVCVIDSCYAYGIKLRAYSYNII